MIHGRKPRNLSTTAAKYTGEFPYFRQPVEFGYFSHDNQGTLAFDSRSLKVLHMPPDPCDVHFDLRENYDTFIQKDDSKMLDDLLQWLLRNRMKFTQNSAAAELQDREQGLNTDFVCWRGVLTKIASSPYERQTSGSWKIAVIKHQGTHYMCEYDTEEKIQSELNKSEREKEMCYWGFKFEQYLCVDNIEDEPNTSVPVNNKENFVSVVRSRLKQHSLVYGGEVDCYRTVNNKKDYVELKTSRLIRNHRENTGFKRNKLKKWWLQSFLIGIPTIICGFRDDNGIVRELKTYDTASLPKLSKDIPYTWDPCVCFNFLDNFLAFVKANVVKDNPRVAYVFEFNPGEDITVREMEESPEYCFLPRWYYAHTPRKLTYQERTIATPTVKA